MNFSQKQWNLGLVFCFALLFMGCSLLPPKFDATEYTNIVKLASYAAQPVCEVPQVERFKAQSVFTKTYAQHLPDNEDTYNSLEEIDAAITTLVTRVKSTQVSPTYCQLKHSTIELMTHTLLDAVGRKPR
jgi:hypothetical protein